MVSNADAICPPAERSHWTGAAFALAPRRRIAIVRPCRVPNGLLIGDPGPERRRAGGTRSLRSRLVPQALSPGQVPAFSEEWDAIGLGPLHVHLLPYDGTIVRLLKSLTARYGPARRAPSRSA